MTTMKKITDYREVSPLVMRHMKRGLITNSFTDPLTYRSEISEGRLFFIEREDCLLFLFQREGFYQVTFYAADEEIRFPEVDQPMICEVAVRRTGLPERNGFLPFFERVHLLRKSTSDVPKAIDTVSYAGERDAEALHQMLISSFDPRTADIPSLTELREECKNHRILVAVKEGAPVGLLRFCVTGKKAEIRHLCVSPAYQGKGYAKQLLNDFLSLFSAHICSVWTGKDNTPARKLYEQFGFMPDGKTSILYQKGL